MQKEKWTRLRTGAAANLKKRRARRRGRECRRRAQNKALYVESSSCIKPRLSSATVSWQNSSNEIVWVASSSKCGSVLRSSSSISSWVKCCEVRCSSVWSSSWSSSPEPSASNESNLVRMCALADEGADQGP